MANRFSTDIIKRQGARKRVVNTNGTFKEVFQNAIGTEAATEYANIALSDKALVGGALNGDTFYAVKSIFSKKGISESSATALALIMIDVAKFQNVSVMKLIEPITSNNELIIDLAAYAVLNFYRPISSKQNILLRNDNSSSFRKRNILS